MVISRMDSGADRSLVKALQVPDSIQIRLWMYCIWIDATVIHQMIRHNTKSRIEGMLTSFLYISNGKHLPLYNRREKLSLQYALN